MKDLATQHLDKLRAYFKRHGLETDFDKMPDSSTPVMRRAKKVKDTITDAEAFTSDAHWDRRLVERKAAAKEASA